MKPIRLAALTILLALLMPGMLFAQEKFHGFKFGTLAPDNTPWSALLQEFQEKVEARSEGKVRMRIYLNGTVGDERAMLQKMRFGQLTGGGFSTGGISTVVPELQILELPFLFRNNAEADHILDNVIWDDMQALLKARGLLLLMWSENGWLDFGNKAKPIRTVADLKGSKWVAQESDIMFAFWEELGVTQVPLAIPEVLSALQTGRVDGYHNTPVFATGAQWHTQSKYWTVSQHIYQPAAVVIDLKFWDRLPPDMQKVVLDVTNEIKPRARKDVRGLDADLLKGFKESGIEINTLTQQERAAFAKATEKVVDKLIAKKIFSRDLYDKIQKGLADFRAKQGSK